jgi:hypothetical protein
MRHKRGKRREERGERREERGERREEEHLNCRMLSRILTS